MTSPLHGEGRRSESGRAHCFSAFFNEIGSEIDSSAFDEKLPTLREKLSTRAKVNECTSTREGAVAIPGLASSSRLLVPLIFGYPVKDIQTAPSREIYSPSLVHSSRVINSQA